MCVVFTIYPVFGELVPYVMCALQIVSTIETLRSVSIEIKSQCANAIGDVRITDCIKPLRHY